MSLQNELRAIGHLIPKLFQGLWHEERNFIRIYSKYIFGILLFLCVAAAGFFGYRWYVASREQKAQYEYSVQFEEYSRALQGEQGANFAAVEQSCQIAYENHTSSHIAPLFLLLLTDIQLQQQKYTEALYSLQRAQESLPAKSPLMNLVKMKRALMQLDAPDEGLQQRGLQELIELARDQKNSYRDMAIFYLGRYYMSQGNTAQAKEAWQEMPHEGMFQRQTQSPWAEEVRRMLPQLNR